MSFINELKVLFVGLLTVMATTATIAVPSAAPQSVATQPVIYQKNTKPAIALPKASSPAQVIPITSPLPGNPTQTSTPLPLNGDNYHYIRGIYSYLGTSIKYHLLIPKNGGSFSGSIEGACQAQLGGNSTGGDPASISGKVGGKCQFVFIKYQGSIDFKGTLYPGDKKIVVELENTRISPITLNY